MTHTAQDDQGPAVLVPGFGYQLSPTVILEVTRQVAAARIRGERREERARRVRGAASLALLIGAAILCSAAMLFPLNMIEWVGRLGGAQ